MKKIILSLTFIGLMASCNQEKTAYVDNTILIQDFYKMKATEARLVKKRKALSDELDSVAVEFQKEVEEFQEKISRMSSEQREQRQNELIQKQQQLQQRQQQKSQILRQEENQALDSINNEVKEFVSNYGKEKGYAYIFGSNETANIMYAKEGLDITEEILKLLNSEGK